MKKYDVRFCNCGRVHFIDDKKVWKAIQNGKQVLVVCNNCGNSFLIGANKSIDEDGNDCYMMYSYSMRDTKVDTPDELDKIDSIIFTAGEQIRMMTGGEATYHGDYFIDWDTKKPDDVSEEKWGEMRKSVNTQHTINWIKDDDKLKEMSQYAVKIDWTNTKYQSKYE